MYIAILLLLPAAPVPPINPNMVEEAARKAERTGQNFIVWRGGYVNHELYKELRWEAVHVRQYREEPRKKFFVTSPGLTLYKFYPHGVGHGLCIGRLHYETHLDPDKCTTSIVRQWLAADGVGRSPTGVLYDAAVVQGGCHARDRAPLPVARYQRVGGAEGEGGEGVRRPVRAARFVQPATVHPGAHRRGPAAGPALAVPDYLHHDHHRTVQAAVAAPGAAPGTDPDTDPGCRSALTESRCRQL